jgi:hypothetical protein
VINTARCEKYELVYEEKSKVKAILFYFNSDFTTVTYGANKQYKLPYFSLRRSAGPQLGIDSSDVAFDVVRN